MCIVCVLYEKDKLTRDEALRALREQIISNTLDGTASEQEAKHHQEVYAEIEKGEK